ncbi:MULTISPECIES: transposase [unclassified Caballeronia]|uniref:transposase n=1 Tax=unclassified Caballeronia TaxID=2646786 RepID=UPI0020285EC5|nr:MULTISPECIES: transposase [unclassified Caballeronia]
MRLRRRRRRYTEDLKARVVAAGQGTGVSVSAVALEHRLNASRSRRWLNQAEGRLPKRSSERLVEAVSNQYRRSFLPLWAPTRKPRRISVAKFAGQQSITVSGPVSEAAMRDVDDKRFDERL